MNIISPLRAMITVEEYNSAPDTVLVTFARFHDYPVTIGVTAADKSLSGDMTALSICRLDVGSTQQDCTNVMADWQRVWPKTRFLPSSLQQLSDRNLAGIPLCLWMTGTPFQHAVWRVLLSIPCGRTMTYGEIAAKLGKPKASRAVGMACGANPIPLIVPCHRVVAANGWLGGYSGRGGTVFKQTLLCMEAA